MRYEKQTKWVALFLWGGLSACGPTESGSPSPKGGGRFAASSPVATVHLSPLPEPLNVAPFVQSRDCEGRPGSAGSHARPTQYTYRLEVDEGTIRGVREQVRESYAPSSVSTGGETIELAMADGRAVQVRRTGRGTAEFEESRESWLAPQRGGDRFDYADRVATLKQWVEIVSRGNGYCDVLAERSPDPRVQPVVDYLDELVATFTQLFNSEQARVYQLETGCSEATGDSQPVEVGVSAHSIRAQGFPGDDERSISYEIQANHGGNVSWLRMRPFGGLQVWMPRDGEDPAEYLRAMSSMRALLEAVAGGNECNAPVPELEEALEVVDRLVARARAIAGPPSLFRKRSRFFWSSVAPGCSSEETLYVIPSKRLLQVEHEAYHSFTYEAEIDRETKALTVSYGETGIGSMTPDIVIEAPENGGNRAEYERWVAAMKETVESLRLGTDCAEAVPELIEISEYLDGLLAES